MVVEPFYNILCAGEEKKPEFIGSRTLDAGDIIQSLSGWTVIGSSVVNEPSFRFPFGGDRSNFREKAAESQTAIQAMNSSLTDLSMKCEPRDANRGLYLLCAPPERMSVELVSDLSTALKRFAINAIIRSGDYPRAKKSLEVAVILSELTSVKRVTDFFNKAIIYIAARRKQRGRDYESRQLETSFGDIPSLLED
jgi:hypothetical protein